MKAKFVNFIFKKMKFVTDKNIINGSSCYKLKNLRIKERCLSQDFKSINSGQNRVYFFGNFQRRILEASSSNLKP